MAQFHLIRHGQASFGAANYDKLSQLGHQQARWLGEYYRARGETFDALVTGDLVRHVETGEGIQEGLGSSLAADLQPGLNEFDFHSIVDAYLSAHDDARAEQVKFNDHRGRPCLLNSREVPASVETTHIRSFAF